MAKKTLQSFLTFFFAKFDPKFDIERLTIVKVGAIVWKWCIIKIHKITDRYFDLNLFTVRQSCSKMIYAVVLNILFCKV